jgi:hypothetical protein
LIVFMLGSGKCEKAYSALHILKRPYTIKNTVVIVYSVY